MYLWSRRRLALSAATASGSSGSSDADYHTVEKLAHAFERQRSSGTPSATSSSSGKSGFDHVAIDASSLAFAAGFLTRDLTGLARDKEMIRIVHRQIVTTLLRSAAPRKTLTLLIDGTPPLWKLQKDRLYPGKHYDSDFQRSAASPMAYHLEEQLCRVCEDLRGGTPAEVIVCGPGVPGPVEGKATAWMLDLATRARLPASNPPNALSSISAKEESVCLLGDPTLFLAALGTTPFSNVTTQNVLQGELRTLSMQKGLQWLGIGHLLSGDIDSNNNNNNNSTSSTSGGSPALQMKRAAAIRTDVVLLYLLGFGLASTGLAPLGPSFPALMDAYIAELEPLLRSADHTDGLLFREYPLLPTNAASATLPTLRLRADACVRVLARAAQKPGSPSGAAAAAAARASREAGNYWEVCLQTHAMLCTGFIPDMGWTYEEGSEALTIKPRKVGIDENISHLKQVAAADSQHELAPRWSHRSQALTGAETLLLAAVRPEMIEQVMPYFAHGHTTPLGLAQEIVSTRDMGEALGKARAALSGLAAEKDANAVLAASSDAGGGDGKAQSVTATPPHPATSYCPSHLYVRAPGAVGPPPSGWQYHSVNLGLKAESTNIRYCMNTTEDSVLRVFEKNK